jgi:hypothetical protein
MRADRRLRRDTAPRPEHAGTSCRWASLAWASRSLPEAPANILGAASGRTGWSVASGATTLRAGMAMAVIALNHPAPAQPGPAHAPAAGGGKCASAELSASTAWSQAATARMGDRGPGPVSAPGSSLARASREAIAFRCAAVQNAWHAAGRDHTSSPPVPHPASASRQSFSAPARPRAPQRPAARNRMIGATTPFIEPKSVVARNRRSGVLRAWACAPRC